MVRYLRNMAMLAAMLMTFAVYAGTYSVDDLPNVQAQDHTKHLVNPDGIISPAVEARIDSLLIDARRQSSAEVVAVIVDDIGSDDIDDYATRLFNKWGLGKHDKNNGILILVSRQGRAATIRTGYGAEGVLPDILCGRIVRQQMIPRFQEGDYEGGMLDAVTEVHRVVTDDEARAELMSAEADNRADDDELSYSSAILVFSVLMLMFFGFVMLCIRGISNQEKYKKTRGIVHFLMFFTAFMGLTTLPAIVVIWLIR